MQDYKNLRVYRKAHGHVLNVRRATSLFPRKGYTPLKMQMTRAAESIPFNIVEGCGSSTPKEFARYLEISIKSAYELDYQLGLAKDYECLPFNKWEPLSKETIEIRKMLFGLRRKVLDSETQPNPAKPPEPTPHLDTSVSSVTEKPKTEEL